VRICHVTPHLPPDQAANALLPYHLGCWARDAGDEVSFIAHPPRASNDLESSCAARLDRFASRLTRQAAGLPWRADRTIRARCSGAFAVDTPMRPRRTRLEPSHP
jgi:hypothetical protein